MDAASGGGFLKGEESVELATEWAEMEWLKVKGYYSMEAFVANRLEVALRLAWLSCNNGGKKRGVKLKEKINAATNSGNVFWRKKGCLDWWMKLDDPVKKKVFRIAVAKVAKCLCAETYKGKNVLAVDMSCSRLQDEPNTKNGFSGMSMVAGYPFQLKCMLNVLMILQDVYSMLAAFQSGGHDADTIFFSSFASVNTTADCILQKLREILMVVSLDCTKFELLDEGTVNLSMKKQKEKLGASNHKKKGKNRNTKKPNPVARSSGNDCSLVNPTEACSSGDKKADLQSLTKKKKKEKKREKSSNTQKSVEVTCCETRENEYATMCVLPQGRYEKSNCVTENPVADSKSNSANVTIDKHGLNNSSINVPPTTMAGGYPADNKFSGLKNCQISETASPNGAVASCVETTEVDVGLKDVHLKAESSDKSMNSANSKRQNEVSTKFIPSCKLSQNYGFREQAIPLRVKGSPSFCDMGIITSSSYISYEWPSLAPPQLSPYNSYLPAATDRLHLDAGHNWHNHFHQPLVPAVQGMRSASVENGFGVVSQPVPMSLDWPPVVRGINRLAPPIACNYDSGFISRRRNSFQQSFSASSAHCSMMSSEDERLCSGEVIDMSDVTNSLELADHPENHWMSEDELELHSLTGMDYNQHFGGGVMYWNPSDFPGSGFSRPPSLSSEDSSWAWREADINRAVDDMVAFSSSYSTNGLTSPSAASLCSPFDPLGPGGQAMGYVLSDSEIAGKVLHASPTVADFVGDENVSGSLSAMSGDGEAKAGDSPHYPILRPIIIPSIPRDLQKSDPKHTEHKSPRIPPNGREAHRIKRPPSPVVLCVPRAPHPPLPLL